MIIDQMKTKYITAKTEQFPVNWRQRIALASRAVTTQSWHTSTGGT